MLAYELGSFFHWSILTFVVLVFYFRGKAVANRKSLRIMRGEDR